MCLNIVQSITEQPLTKHQYIVLVRNVGVNQESFFFLNINCKDDLIYSQLFLTDMAEILGGFTITNFSVSCVLQLEGKTFKCFSLHMKTTKKTSNYEYILFR